MKNIKLLFTFLVLVFFSLKIKAQDQTYNFNGTSQYASVPYNAALNPSTFTIEAWALVTGGAGSFRAVVSSRGSTTYAGYVLYAGDDNNWQFWAGDNGSSWTRVFGPAVTLNKWTHLAGVYSGGTMTFYVDGVLAGSTTLTLSVNNTGPFNIGAVDDNGSSPQLYFPGDVDEVRLWNTARTPAQIRANLFKDLSVTDSGLVADYKGDVTGTTLTNSCTNVGGLNGTTHNNPPQYPSSIAYQQNALFFDGSNDYVEVANNAALQNSSFSVDVRANRNSGGSGYETVLSYLGGNSHTGYAFYVHDNKWKLAYGNGSSYQYLIGPAVTNGTWTHLAATYNGTTLKFYVDGVEISSSNVTVAINSTNPFYLGADYIGDYINGKVDEVKIYNAAKSIGELTNNLYSNFDPTTATNLVAYYSFNQGLHDQNNGFLTTLYDNAGGHNGAITNFALNGSTSNFVQGAPLVSSVGPGVVGTSLWLKANDGATNSGSNLTGWTDQTGINTFTKTGTIGYQTNAVNFNPVVAISSANLGSTAPDNRLEGNTNIQVADAFAVYIEDVQDESGSLVGNSDGTFSGYMKGVFLGRNDAFYSQTDGNNGRAGVYSSKIGVSYKLVNNDLSPATTPFWQLTENGVDLNPPAGDLQPFTSISIEPSIGGSVNPGGATTFYHFKGKVAEILTYPTGLNATDKSKVQSYLAVKYGISLGDNTNAVAYLSSAGATIWPANATYKYDVFGIGKDDGSGLNQTSSNSVNTGSGDGTGQSGKGNIVLSNPSTLTNGTFLMLGHDNAALTEQTTEVPTAGQRRIAREWLVKRTGDPGTVDLSFDILGLGLTTAAANFKLLIDADGDFSSGATTVNASSLTGTKVAFTGVTIPNGSYLTIVTNFFTPVGPGVLGASLWLKANDGATTSGSNLTGWTDQTGINTFTKTGTIGFITNAVNFNPAVVINNENSPSNPIPANRLDGGSPITIAEAFGVFKSNSSTYHTTILGSSVNPGAVHAIWAGATNGSTTNTQQTLYNNNVIFTTNDALSAKFTINGLRFNTSVFHGAELRIDGTQLTGGQYIASTGSNYFNNMLLTPMIGGTYNVSNNDFYKGLNGEIAEIILFPTALSPTDRSKTQTYLALKYGITLGADVTNYLASNSTTIWNNLPAWAHDVFGIGIDNGSGLNQTQSNSINTGSGDGTGQSGKGNIVLSNASSLNDGDFLIIGNNNDALNEGTSDLPALLNGKKRLSREWKVALTNTVGTVTLTFNTLGLTLSGTTASDFKLIIDEDRNGNFTDGTITQITPTSYTNNILTFDNITLNDAVVFTFVTGESVLAGGLSGAVLWYDAATGVILNGGTVSQWNNQGSILTANATQATAANQPQQVTTGANQINFNPILSFDATDELTTPANTLLGNDGGYAVGSQFAVYRVTSDAAAFVYHADGGDPLPMGESSLVIGLNNDGMVHQTMIQSAGTNPSPLNSVGQVVLINMKSKASANEDFSVPNAYVYSRNGITGATVGTVYIGGINLSPQLVFGKNGAVELAEMILFNRYLTPAEVNKMESYFAIKYGITLGNNTSPVNYVLSDGTTTVWTGSTTHQNDIFGIGKNVAGVLTQTQSNSMNTGNGDGTGISGKGNILLSNASSLDDGDFLMLGHDNAALTEQTTEVPTAGQRRIAREWFAKRTGDPGTVDLSFDILGLTVTGTAAADFKLLIDADGDFSSGATVVNASSLTGTKVNFNGVALPNGSYCTFVTGAVLGGNSWIGVTNSDWTVTTNWSANQIPTASDDVIIPITPNNPVINSGVNAVANKITIQSGANLTIDNDGFLTVTDVLDLGGDIILENHASLIQINDVVNTASTGTMILKRTSSLRNLDYVYWSSPVTNFNVNNISPLTTIVPELKWESTIAANMNGYGNWVPTSENMVIGKGYAVRAPDGFTTTPALFNTSFTGIPNNGTISTPISRGVYDGADYDNDGNPATANATKNDDNFNLIGNPYPSAISADAFLNANLNIEGFVNIWSHGTLPSSAVTSPFYGSFIYNYRPTDYITYNKSGQSSGPGSFNGNIASGQGFFVLMKANTAATTENVTFTNAMRSSSYDNDHFFRSPADEGRIWLDIVEQDNNTHLRTLVAYKDGATDGVDRDYDAITDRKPILNIFSLIGTDIFKIQGRTTPLNQNDIVPIGITVPANGDYHIGIGQLDGIFTNPTQGIYLEDKDLNQVHDLKANPYYFNANAGVYENRFLLKYTNTLSANDFDSDAQVLAYSSNNKLIVKSFGTTLNTITVFDVMGRKLATYNSINENEVVLEKLNKTNTILLLEIELSNGITVNKKVIH